MWSATTCEAEKAPKGAFCVVSDHLRSGKGAERRLLCGQRPRKKSHLMALFRLSPFEFPVVSYRFVLFSNVLWGWRGLGVAERPAGFLATTRGRPISRPDEKLPAISAWVLCTDPIGQLATQSSM